MTLQEITAKMQEGASKKSAFGNSVKFATDQGVVHIDGNQTPPAVSNEDKAADCTIKMDFADFADLIGGKLDKVRRCANPECGWLFLDDSRAGKRRWCSMSACGNRAKARRHYHKSREP